MSLTRKMKQHSLNEQEITETLQNYCKTMQGCVWTVQKGRGKRMDAGLGLHRPTAKYSFSLLSSCIGKIFVYCLTVAPTLPPWHRLTRSLLAPHLSSLLQSPPPAATLDLSCSCHPSPLITASQACSLSARWNSPSPATSLSRFLSLPGFAFPICSAAHS